MIKISDNILPKNFYLSQTNAPELIFFLQHLFCDVKCIKGPPHPGPVSSRQNISYTNKKSIVPGEMGKRDVKYVQAVYEAMRTGQRVLIKAD